MGGVRIQVFPPALKDLLSPHSPPPPGFPIWFSPWAWTRGWVPTRPLVLGSFRQLGEGYSAWPTIPHPLPCSPAAILERGGEV